MGRVDDDAKRVMRASRQSLDAAIKLCKPGALFRDLGKAMCVAPPDRTPHGIGVLTVATPYSEPVARAAGCSVVRQYTGHGINDLFHTAPNIPHYAKNRAVGQMKAGMVREPC